MLDVHVALPFPSMSYVKIGDKSSTEAPFLEIIQPVMMMIMKPLGHVTH